MTVILRAEPTTSVPALLLRPWNGADAEPLVEAYRDPTLRRWTRLPVESSEDALRWLAVQRNGWADGSRLSFAVVAEQPDGSDRLLGNVVVKTPGQVVGLPEVGYWTAAYARGRGVASRALDVLSGWAFDTLGVDRLALLHQVDNSASCRVAEKTGYRFDRTLPARPPFPRDGHLHLRPATPRQSPVPRPLIGGGVPAP
ncbi:GNAT family N-acetyltransferase [Micromonospora sp. WMMD1102]|uniref:GNAT family N-acetyltransferase n=1 Tax=Micromonospora sp. WMMD1102 TaxID=3016105 RepID=UPI002414E99C|nr:GNAT family N-acetyltransferase [Micromonospora sp. WMMD1102]MDG4791397.1 GNAT family N-acetyltransferase [Micromonospora sp. WMMD1102]